MREQINRISGSKNEQNQGKLFEFERKSSGTVQRQKCPSPQERIEKTGLLRSEVPEYPRRQQCSRPPQDERMFSPRIHQCRQNNQHQHRKLHSHTDTVIITAGECCQQPIENDSAKRVYSVITAKTVIKFLHDHRAFITKNRRKVRVNRIAACQKHP